MASAIALAVTVGYGAAYGDDSGNMLPIRADQISAAQNQALMNKAAALESRIQMRQQQYQHQQELPSTPTEDSKGYQAGFSDGYNKAILDLVKARLLNDPSLTPKLKQAILLRANYANPANGRPPSSDAPSLSAQPVSAKSVSAKPLSAKPLSAEPLSNILVQQRHGYAAGNVRQFQVVVKTSPALDTKMDSMPQRGANNERDADNASPEKALLDNGANYKENHKENHKEVMKNGQNAFASTVNAEATSDTFAAASTSAIATASTSITTATVTTAPVVIASPVATPISADSDKNAAKSPANTILVNTNPVNNMPSSVTTDSPKANAASRDKAQDWLQKSNAYLKEKHWPQAIKAATAAIALDAGLADSYIARSWAYAENGQMQQAMGDVDTAIRLQPNNALAYNNKGYVLELANKPGKAQESYQKACDLKYQQACVTVDKMKQVLTQQRKAKIDELINLSYRQFRQKDWNGVIKTTTELLGLDSENTTALVNRAGAYTELGLFNKALDDCNNALIIDPKMPLAYNNKGYALERMGQPKKAALEYQTACVLGIQQSCSDFKRLSQKVSSR